MIRSAVGRPKGSAGKPARSQLLYDADKECCMKDKRFVRKVDKLSLKSVVLWGAFAAAVLAGLGGVRWAALASFKSGNNEVASKLTETIALDPFAPTTAEITSKSQDSPPANMSQDAASAKVLKWPAIRIPHRPALRSPFRPALVPTAKSSGSTGLPTPKETTVEKPAM